MIVHCENNDMQSVPLASLLLRQLLVSLISILMKCFIGFFLLGSVRCLHVLCAGCGPILNEFES